MEAFQAPGGIYVRRYIPPKRQSELTAEQYGALTEILTALHVPAVYLLHDFADKAVNEDCEGFISNLNAFFTAADNLKSERERTAARNGLQAVANLVYLVGKYENTLLDAVKLFYEVEKAKEDDAKERAARGAWNREFAAESAKIAPQADDE